MIKNKKWPSLLVLSLILIFAGILFPFQHFLPSWNQWGGTYDLSPGSRNGPNLWFFQWGIMRGSVSISGGNNDLYFYIGDSMGKPLLDAGLIHDGYMFEWQVPKTDVYSFYYSNSMSWFTSKNVMWHLEISYYNLLFPIIGTICLLIGIVYLYREENLSQKLKQEIKKPRVITIKEPGYVKEREVIREVVKIRCPYCGNTYDERLDKCPNCGGKRP